MLCKKVNSQERNFTIMFLELCFILHTFYNLMVQMVNSIERIDDNKNIRFVKTMVRRLLIKVVLWTRKSWRFRRTCFQKTTTLNIQYSIHVSIYCIIHRTNWKHHIKAQISTLSNMLGITGRESCIPSTGKSNWKSGWCYSEMQFPPNIFLNLSNQWHNKILNKVCFLRISSFTFICFLYLCIHFIATVWDQRREFWEYLLIYLHHTCDFQLNQCRI